MEVLDGGMLYILDSQFDDGAADGAVQWSHDKVWPTRTLVIGGPSSALERAREERGWGLWVVSRQ